MFRFQSRSSVLEFCRHNTSIRIYTQLETFQNLAIHSVCCQGVLTWGKKEILFLTYACLEVKPNNSLGKVQAVFIGQVIDFNIVDGVEATWNLTANTAFATTLDINVDSQTRQR